MEETTNRIVELAHRSVSRRWLSSSQQSAQDLRVEDGWRYFVHGWTTAIAEVLHLDISTEEFRELVKIAEAQRQPQ